MPLNGSRVIDISNATLMHQKVKICNVVGNDWISTLVLDNDDVMKHLTLKAPRKNATENVVCFRRLLHIFDYIIG